MPQPDFVSIHAVPMALLAGFQQEIDRRAARTSTRRGPGPGLAIPSPLGMRLQPQLCDDPIRDFHTPILPCPFPTSNPRDTLQAMRRRPHIAVIGAGIVGAAIAYRLAKAGGRVTVVEAASPAAAATGKSFGWINASFFANPAHFQLRAAAIDAHRALDAEIETGVQWTGALWWEESGSAFDRQAESLTALGYPVRVVNRAEFSALEPAVADAPARCLMFPAEGAVDAALLAERLLAAAARHDASLWLGCAATGLQTSRGRISGVRTATGTLNADHVIVAAGTASPDLLAPLGIALPMLSRPGLLLHTCPVPRVINHILASPGQEFRQSADGRIIAPTAAGHQADQTGGVHDLPGDLAERALERLRAVLVGVDLKLERVMLAHRPVPEDGLPVVGAVGPDGLHIATMHSGVTLAPLIGNLIADEILHGQISPLLTPFRPGRFNTSASLKPAEH